MNQRPPLVSIGMPTFNGELYIARALDSLLAQDYPNLELIISDNGSTDGTEAIARDYAGRFDRVRYVRQQINLGAYANFNFVLGEATGEYFMWAADHDLHDPTFVSKCVAALEADPAAVLAYPQSYLIDENGSVIEEMDDQIDLGQPSALYRYKHLIWRLIICNMIYGVSRREAMAATGGFPDIISPDHGCLARMVLQGTVLRVGGHLFLRRRNRPPETPDEHRRRALVDLEPSKAGARASMPPARLFRDLRAHHLEGISRSSLTFREKLDARMATLACFHLRFHVASNLVRVCKLIGIVTGQTKRFDRWWGRAD